MWAVMVRFDPQATFQRVFGPRDAQSTAQSASTRPSQGADGFDKTSSGPKTVWGQIWSFLGNVVQRGRMLLSSFASLFAADRGSQMPKENPSVAAAQIGAVRGRVVSKGATLAGHVMDAQAKYADAKRVATTSIAYASHAGVPKPIVALAEADVASLDGRADQIFENIGNRHRSSQSRRNQRAKLDDVIGELHAIAQRMDAAGA
jgi:hypothetical protein